MYIYVCMYMYMYIYYILYIYYIYYHISVTAQNELIFMKYNSLYPEVYSYNQLHDENSFHF